MTRALGHLLRTEWSAAVAMHPLAPLIVIAALASLAWWLGSKRLGWRPIGRRVLDRGLLVGASLLVTVWVLRWATASLPPVTGLVIG